LGCYANLQQDLDRAPQTSLLFWLLPDGRDLQERVCPRRSDTQARIAETLQFPANSKEMGPTVFINITNSNETTSTTIT